jgi:septum formation protein
VPGLGAAVCAGSVFWQAPQDNSTAQRGNQARIEPGTVAAGGTGPPGNDPGRPVLARRLGWRGDRLSHLVSVFLLLASTSPARHALLAALGLPFEAVAPGVEESVPPGTPVEAAVRLLAERKARAVAATRPGALVIGADQLGELDGRLLGKPVSRSEARGQLLALAGRTHRLLTAVCLAGGGREETVVEEARLTLWPLTEAEVESYLDTGEWEGCAGAYRVEGRGQALMSRIDGDRTCIQGLPMQAVVRLLRGRGVALLGPA